MAPSGVMHSQQFQNLVDIDPVLHEIFNNTYRGVPRMREFLFNVQSSDKAKETDFRIGSMSDPKEWDGQVEYDAPSADYEIAYRHVKYQKGVQVQKELLDDNQYPQAFDMIDSLGLVFGRLQEKNAVSVFNNAFNAAYPGYDGKPLIANDHPRSKVDSAAVDNYLGTVALTSDNLEEAIQTLEALGDDRGELTEVQANVLLVGRANRKKAYELTGSELTPENANNAVNVFNSNYGLRTVYHPRITGNLWFVADYQMMKKFLKWFDRLPVNSDSTIDFDKEVLKFKATGRWSFGWSDFRWIVGANPSS